MNDPGKQRHLDWILKGATWDSWLVPSALLSSRWSRDNPLTPDPSRLYSSSPSRRVGLTELQDLLEAFGRGRADVEVTSGSLGVLSWNVNFRQGDETRLLVLPLALDLAEGGERAHAQVPKACYQNAEFYLERGLDRFLFRPVEQVSLAGGVVGSVFSVPSGYRTLSFRQGRVRIDVQEEAGDWVLPLGERPSASILSELIAAMTYHYVPEAAGGTALCDVLVNDGDFLVRRKEDGSFQLKLTVARSRREGIPKNRFLLHLMQFIAYEDWTIGSDLTGLPVLISHPSLVLSGVTRGLLQRHADLGLGEEEALSTARSWFSDFARSPEGRGYRPWIERFLSEGSSDDACYSTLDDDPRIRWWNLTELRQRRNVAELRYRASGDVESREKLEALTRAVDLLSRRLERAPRQDELGRLFVSDLDRGQLESLLEDSLGDRFAPGVASHLANEWFHAWPYRRESDLPPALLDALAPEVRARLDFREPLPAERDSDLGTLEEDEERPAPLANPEVFGAFAIPPALCATAARLLPSFEQYMDDVLHHPDFGYYTGRVSIGQGGHFSTHPEDLSPDYGGWVAQLIRDLFLDLRARGELGPGEPFHVVEFGAGTGRLARDILDAIFAQASSAKGGDPFWQELAARLRYQIYELSPSLREQQRSLLKGDVVISAGDARAPSACLERDFADGLRGIVLSNELPDAFGVHKVVLSAEGRAFAIVVTPRIERGALAKVTPELRQAVIEADTHLRRTFAWTRHPEDLFLDRETFRLVMREVMSDAFGRTQQERDLLLDALWFEEGLVPATTYPELARSLRRDRHELAQALEESNSGAVIYPNPHAESFIEQVATALRGGFCLTIDYGHSTREMLLAARQRLFPLRVYRQEGRFIPLPSDPYARPGTQDLTADVNFTSLARAGVGAGLTLVHYGLERDLAHAALPAALRAESGSAMERFLGNPLFKLLVLGKGPLTARGHAAWGEHFEALPLFVAEGGATSERALEIEAILAEGATPGQGTDERSEEHQDPFDRLPGG